MKVVCIGGGPAGLYFSILLKKAFPATEIEIFERNRPDDTFGWGVVFSDETLANFGAADPPTYEAITGSFKYWRDIHTYFGGTRTDSTGHGFAALSRKKLLLILQERCRELGIDLHFQREVRDLASFADADLILGADGVNSTVRELYAEHFEPDIDWRKCRFCWLGTDLPLEAFTFIFEESEYGLFQVHAYPFEEGLGTWIVECREEVFAAAGLEAENEAHTIAFCEELFRPYLRGHRLLGNRSHWRTFPTVRCRTWCKDNVVLMGDAAHTAHFSIGSGTKLAMEDALALARQFVRLGVEDVGTVLAAYQDARWVETIKTQKAAQTSLEWFENSARYMTQPPVQLTFNLMTRSKQITYDNLAARDPQLVAAVDEWFRAASGAPETSAGKAPQPVFTPFRLRELELVNRVVVSPMCQYSAQNGSPNDWHLVHLGSRAVGGAGLVMTEMTDVLPEGRITYGCAGMYAEEHVGAWKRIVDFVHGNSGAAIGMQLAHAGRKGSVSHPWEGEDVPLSAEEGAWETIAPSPVPYYPDWPVPREMDRRDMDRVVAAFAEAARLAGRAGFDLLELHLAHGYLLSSFLSPLSNVRSDRYGGSLDARMRFPLEVFEAVRAVWPAEKPLAARISATDWLGDRGSTPAHAVDVARALQGLGCDLIDVSSSGNSPESRPDYGRMYHVPFADRIRHEVGIPVAVVGALLGADHANTVLAAGRADLAVMARPHLRDPYLTLRASLDYDYPDQRWPGQYLPARRVPRRPKEE